MIRFRRGSDRFPELKKYKRLIGGSNQPFKEETDEEVIRLADLDSTLHAKRLQLPSNFIRTAFIISENSWLKFIPPGSDIGDATHSSGLRVHK